MGQHVPDMPLRVRLVPFSRRHLEDTLAWVNLQELAHFTGTLFPVSRAAHYKWFNQLKSDPLRRWFAIEADGAHCGNTGVKRLDPENLCAELFIYIGGERFRGCGIGVRATERLTEWCFGRLGLHRVFAQVFAYNAAALACYERAGFERDAILREHYFHQGRRHDQIVLARVNHGVHGSQ
jgi:RimJ/RimL family protein N-acetyltransferase